MLLPWPQGFDVKVDESALTGEAVLVKKDVNSDPILYGGTKVSTCVFYWFLLAKSYHLA